MRRIVTERLTRRRSPAHRDPIGSHGVAATLAAARRGTDGGEATISVVIPTLNEAANLPPVLSRLPSSVDEVVLVDGHSVDDTIEVARAIRGDVRVILQSGRGKATRSPAASRRRAGRSS